ncbi:MAG: hydrogenase maturation protease [Phycisphaerae bacterium]|jgi:hydrogenase maturation protease
MLTKAEPTRPTPTAPRPILVLGLGNILLRDEGVGVRVVQSMQRMDLPPGVELLDGATGGLDLLDALADRQKVIVIDAIEGDYEPGTVLRLNQDDLAVKASMGVSLHDLGLLELLVAAAQLGIAPAEVIILGVKPKEVEYGLELSPQTAALLPKIINLVFAELDTCNNAQPVSA